MSDPMEMMIVNRGERYIDLMHDLIEHYNMVSSRSGWAENLSSDLYTIESHREMLTLAHEESEYRFLIRGDPDVVMMLYLKYHRG